MNGSKEIRELNNKNINAYNELFDKGCMILVEKGNKKNYLDAFIALSEYICEKNVDTFGLDNRAINSLNNVIDKIYNLDILNEEVREALILNIVKGLKHSDLPLEYATPDVLVYLYSNIINNLFGEEPVTILETNVGMGILMNGLINNLDNDVEYVGLSKDEKTIKVASSLTNLCMNEARLYNNDPMDENIKISSNVCIIDDIINDKSENKYSIYDYILKYNELSDYCVALIDNDFFNNNEFKLRFKGTMLGLICLPEKLFKEGKAKSILVMSKKVLSNYDVMVIQIPDFNDREKLARVLSGMNNWLKNISYKNIYND